MSAYATGSIAGIALVGPASAAIKCQLDASAFFDTFEGATTPAADGTQHTQLVDVGTAGKRFEVYFDFMPLDVLASIKTAIGTALGNGTSFPVVLADDAQSINVDCVPDYSAKWVEYGRQRMNATYLAAVTFRFLSVD